MDNLVTVVIPVGPGHERWLPDALRSVQNQSYEGWEVIVSDDTGGRGLGLRKPFKLVRTGGGAGAGAARNLALSKVKTPFVVWLDSDDMLFPRALEMLLRGFVFQRASYVYGDWYSREEGERYGRQLAPEYQQSQWLVRCWHVVTTLMPTSVARAVGGFDPDLRGWEDWEFYVKLASRGFCGAKIPSPILVYDVSTGSRRNASSEMGLELYTSIRSRFQDYIDGRVATMPCCGQGDTAAAQAAQQAVNAMPGLAQGTKVLLEYLGENVGPIQTVVNGRTYAGAKNSVNKWVYADPSDVGVLLNSGLWRLVPVASEDILPTRQTTV